MRISADTTIPNWNGDALDLPYAAAVFTGSFGNGSAEASRPTRPANPNLN